MDKTLLLDRNYLALSVVPWQRVVRLIMNGKAEPVGDCKYREIKTSRYNFFIPSVIRLLVQVPWKAHSGRSKFSRRNVLLRDANKCQYCGLKVGRNATIDHVVPKSRGGKTDYSNCVACCSKCNSKKADNTPEEVGMILLNKPKKPTFVSLYRSYFEEAPEEWKNYIISLVENEKI